jgi:serine/threonine protein kinase
MGAVYECVDEATERARAIKIMHAHTLDSADARARFELEARVSGRVDSPYLVDVVDAGVDGGVPYLVMELLAGDDLGQRLERMGPRPAAEVVGQLAQVALALSRLHARGIVHRDLKPSNL